MTDYPDYTTLTQIVGTDIDIPVSIDAQTVTLEVDIIAQTVGDITIDIAAQSVGNLAVNLAASAITLDVDITAQTVGNLSVNLAASAITLDVDINAQSVGDLTISIDAQSVGVYLQPEWSALQGDDINLQGTVLCVATGNFYQALTYTVTNGKTFYCCAFGFFLYSIAGGCCGYIYNNTTATVLAETGGYNGNAISLNKPIAVAQNQVVRVYVNQLVAANHNMSAFLLGYEI